MNSSSNFQRGVPTTLHLIFLFCIWDKRWRCLLTLGANVKFHLGRHFVISFGTFNVFFFLNFNVLITDKFHTKTTFLLILHYLIKTSNNNRWNIFLCVVKSWNDSSWMSERRSFQGQNYLHEGEEVKNFNNNKKKPCGCGRVQATESE